MAAKGDTSSEKGYVGYLQAKNSYNSALRTYQGTVLKAPFAGTITAVNGTVGGSSGGSGGSSSSSGSDSGSGGSSSGWLVVLVFVLVELRLHGDRRHCEPPDPGNFTEADTTKLKVGQSAAVSFDALTGKTATGKITAIGMAPTTTDNVVKFPATISLGDVPSGVRLGQTATVEITVAKAEDVLYVPSAAVRTVAGRAPSRSSGTASRAPSRSRSESRATRAPRSHRVWRRVTRSSSRPRALLGRPVPAAVKASPAAAQAVVRPAAVGRRAGRPPMTVQARARRPAPVLDLRDVTKVYGTGETAVHALQASR